MNKMQAGGPDFRKRITVYLIAADMPFHQDFFCASCGMKVCEIDDSVVYMTDTHDITRVSPDQAGAITVRCKGKYCRKYYEFVLRPSKW